MKNKFLLVVVIAAILFIMSIAIQFAMGVLKFGIWMGVIMTLIVISFIAAKLIGNKRN